MRISTVPSIIHSSSSAGEGADPLLYGLTANADLLESRLIGRPGFSDGTPSTRWPRRSAGSASPRAASRLGAR